MPAWEVASFSLETLRRLLIASEHTVASYVQSKKHTTYFHDYLGTLGARTIVAERDYVDRDYLEDFAAWYVSCHPDYARRCTRLHFFSHQFETDQFSALLAGTPSQLTPHDLESSYLGFIVVKPLPETIFGRTCVATYPHEGRRHFPITRRYQVSLFGFKLEVTSLAFQEQDQGAAACATSALWSAFHGTGVLFQHHIPSPVEITRTATKLMPIGGRALPSSGLTPLQMALAIRQVTLEPTVLGSVDDPQQWKATAYAYMQARIPVLVAGLLNDHSGPAAPRSIGRHAIVLTGFSLGRPDAIKCGDIPITFTASRIDKFYAHDDQIGAFARMPCPDTKNRFSFETSWIGSTGRMTVQFVPETIFVPLYHKIRVPFSHVRSELLRFEATLESLRTLGLSASIPTIEWDVRLTYVNELKSTFAADAPAGPLRRDLLEARMPRFIWRARGLVAGVCHLDLLFDATGIEKGNCCFRVVEWVTNIGDVLRGIAAASPDACTALAAEPSWRVVRWIVGP